MSLILAALAVGAGAGLILGGRLRNLAGARLRWAALLIGGAVCEYAGSRWGTGTAGTVVMVVGYVLLLGFAVRNVALTGMVLVVCGLLANLAVIVVDNGMPVRGVPAGTTYGARHHGVRPGDRLLGLSDQIRLTPLGATVSPGDIVLSLGVATVTVGLMRPRRRPAMADA
jgi:hypothetical protein